MALSEDNQSYHHPLYDVIEKMPGVDVALTSIDKLLSWGSRSSLWIFPMATSCCGIEFMSSASARFDTDRIGTIPRSTPRQCDVMVIAGTITVKMAPRVKKLWDQMPEPKWVMAMGSCAIGGGPYFKYGYHVVKGVDLVVPVDVYVPGCPPRPEALLEGVMRIQDKIKGRRLAKQSGSAGRFRSGEKISDESPIPHHTGYAADPEALQV